jgi:hypothetical protein
MEQLIKILEGAGLKRIETGFYGKKIEKGEFGVVKWKHNTDLYFASGIIRITDGGSYDSALIKDALEDA